MANIPFSIARNWISDRQSLLQQQIDHLANQLDFPIKPDYIDWSELWDRLNQIADEKQGPYVSEVGSTWVASLYAKQALSSIYDYEIEHIGGEDSFLAWEVGTPANLYQKLTLPWMADSQVIVYWKDMLADVGIDPADGFRTITAFEGTLDRLSRHKHQYPWAISTTRFPANLHQLACWIWGVGGEFLSESGTHLRLMEDEAMKAIVNFFSLHRFVPEYRTTSPMEMTDYFAQREAVITMGGIKLYNRLVRTLSSQEMENVGVSLPPGIPFVGCESLVLWSHTPEAHREQAIDLLRAIMSTEMQERLAPVVDLMPTRIDVLQKPPYSTDPFLRTLSRAISIGKSYPPIPAWGVLENQLLDTIVIIWEEIFSDQNPDIHNIVQKHLIRLSTKVAALLG